MKAEYRPQYFGALESMRGMAALTVALYHTGWTNPVSDLAFVRNGYLMVDFFFVLSGFVICHSYGGKIDSFRSFSRFIWLRLGRLYPLHVALLFVFLAFEFSKKYAADHYGLTSSAAPFHNNNLYSFVTNIFLIQSLNLHNSLTYNGPSWSISSEFYTYIVFGSTLLLLKPRYALILGSILIVTGGLGVLAVAGITSLDDATIRWGFFRCLVGFFMGVLTYQGYLVARPHLMSSRRSWLAENLVSAISLFAVAIYLSIKPPYSDDYFILPMLMLLIFSAAIPDTLVSKVFSARPIRWLGKVSYSVYMVHAAVAWLLGQILTIIIKVPATWSAGHTFRIAHPSITVGTSFVLLYVGLVLIVSRFTFNLIEEPFRRLSRAICVSNDGHTEPRPLQNST